MGQVPINAKPMPLRSYVIPPKRPENFCSDHMSRFTRLYLTQLDFSCRAFVQPKLPSCPKFYPRIGSKAQFKTGQTVALWIIVPQLFDQNALVAQLDRALDYESRGQGFESSRAHHIQCTFGFKIKFN